MIRQKFETRAIPNLTLCLWLFFSLKGLASNQASSSSSSSSCATTSARSSVSLSKVVNPLGTVTTIVESPRDSTLADEFVEEYSSGAYLHENSDESTFRPYVAVFSGSIDSENHTPQEKPEPIGQKLIVPVIDGSQIEQKNREKARLLEMKRQQEENVAKFEQMSLLNRTDKNASTVKVDVKVEKTKKSTAKNTSETKDDDKVQAKESKVDKSADKKNDNSSNSEKKTTIDSNPTETVTVKLKKKGNKAQTKLAEQPIESDDTGKKASERSAADTSYEKLEFNVATSDKNVESEKVEEFVPPKPVKSSKKKMLAESSSSKESSVEKDSAPTPAADGAKSKKKKKKNDAQSAVSSSDDSKPLDLLGDAVDTSFLEDIDKIDGAQCAEIQTSLLKSSVGATVSMRKGSLQEKVEDNEGNVAKSSKSGKKKKMSKESIDIEYVTPNTPDEPTEFVYPDTSDSVLELDNLSFKSTIDDHINLIPTESLPMNEMEWAKDRTTDYDKLSDDAETGSGAQYSDCKSFQLIIDESYMPTSDTTSSDETDNSSRSKSTKSSEKTVDDDDEELQPLISSTTSDVAVDLSKSDALPNEANQSDSTTQPQTSEQNQQQPQPKPANNNGGNKKKRFGKKRR